MAPEPTDLITTVQRIKSALPTLIDNLNADERLPWVNNMVLDELEIVRVPIAFVTEAIRTASMTAIEISKGKTVKPEIIGSRLVVIETPHASEEYFIADLSLYNEKSGILGITSFRFNYDGTIADLNDPKTYQRGESLNDSTHYVLTSVTRLILDSADDKHAASGISYEEIDRIKVYEYKHSLDSDTESPVEPVRLSPKSLPRVRKEIAKELKHYGTQQGYEKAAIDYFNQMGSQIEATMESWWVSEDMTKLAWDAALSGTEPEDLSEKELPSPSGIMWLNGKGGPALLTKHFPNDEFFKTGLTQSELVSINAIIWYTPTVPIEGLEVDQPRFMGLTASPALARESAVWNSTLSPLDVESNSIEQYRIPTYATTGVLKFLPRKMALIVMRLAREETVGEKHDETVAGGWNTTGKKTKKNRSIERITCASLQRRTYASDEEREAESREYSHRWIVRGHMRNQPVGPRNIEGGQKHERVWIAPYVKGPENKPLVLKERVQVWR